MLSYHGALNNRSAMGGYLEHDRTYPSNQTNLNLNYAYHVPLMQKELIYHLVLEFKTCIII